MLCQNIHSQRHWPLYIWIVCKLNFYQNISENMFENIRQDPFWHWKWQFFLTLKMCYLTLIMGNVDEDDERSQIALVADLFCFTNQKEFYMEHYTSTWTLLFILHFTLFTLDFRTLWLTIFKLLVWRSDKGNFTWNSFPSETLVDTRERIGNATALPTVKNYQRKTWTFALMSMMTILTIMLKQCYCPPNGKKLST